MKKTILIMALFIALLMVSFATAIVSEIQCSNDANNVGQNPEASIVLCDDPTDATCEQDFETLCPTNWHLCDATEYNMGNDNWEGTVPNWLLGEITCRDYGGAGHYTVWNVGEPFSNNVVFNQYAGSSLPECQSDYGCNEQQYYALCCYGSASNGGNDDMPPDEPPAVPEFGVVAAGVALIGALGIFVIKRK